MAVLLYTTLLMLETALPMAPLLKKLTSFPAGTPPDQLAAVVQLVLAETLLVAFQTAAAVDVVSPASKIAPVRNSGTLRRFFQIFIDNRKMTLADNHAS